MRLSLRFAVLLLGVMSAVPSSAQVPVAPGSIDPLGLAAIGVVIPFFASGANVSYLELASPVGDNLTANPLRLVFFTADCTRSSTTTLPVSNNGIQIVNLGQYVNFDGLLLIGGTSADGLTTVPLASPIHARIRWVNSASNFERTLEPITVASAEAASSQAWNPLRSAATFIAPRQGRARWYLPNVETTLYLICPSAAITQEISGAPSLVPPAAKGFFLRVYDANEYYLRNLHSGPWACLTTLRLTDIDAIYTGASVPSPYYYTEMEGEFPGVSGPGSFMGYIATRTSPLFGATRDDFHRLHSGNVQSLQGAPGGGIDTQDR